MRFLFILLLSVITGCSTVSSKSEGCTNLNDPSYDSSYHSGSVFFSPFNVGESVWIKLVEENLSEAQNLLFIIRDSSQDPAQELLRSPSNSQDVFSYTFTQDHAALELFWAADAGVPLWEFECRFN